MERTALQPRVSGNGSALPTERGWRLTVPAGDTKTYRLAQVDDHSDTPRGNLPWQLPASFQLRARASGRNLPGTWGFGLWNIPFGLACGPTAESTRLPAPPQSAWFFAASPSSYLSFRDGGPANGFFAQALRSPRVGIWLLQAALTFPISALAARRALARHIREEAVSVTADAQDWHDYRIAWNEASTVFAVDGRAILSTESSPRPPLGLVIWIDNQFARFDPEGRLAWGLEACATESWLEFEDLTLQSPGKRRAD